MMISIGIRGVGVPCGSKWAKDVFGLFRNPIITVAIHKGMAMLIFIESWVVGVKEYGRRPSKFVDEMNRINDISMRVQVWPCLLCSNIICLVISRINQICSVWIRLENKCFGVERIRQGSIMIIGNMVVSIIVGVMNWVNRFLFIFCFRVIGFLLVFFFHFLGLWRL